MGEWREITGHAGYEVNNEGHVRSFRRNPDGKILSPHRRRSGHLAVRLTGRKMQSIHRLVARAFHGDPLPGQEVRHLDGNPTNNAADNLCWGTRSENQIDVLRHGGKRGVVLDEDAVRQIRNLHAVRYSITELSVMFGVNTPQISRIVYGKRWSYVS